MSNKEVKKFIEGMVEKRMSYAEVGKLLGISRQRVHQIYKGYKPPKTKKVKEGKMRVPPVSVVMRPGYIYDSTGITLEGKDRLKEMVRRRDKYTCQICLRKWKKGERRLDVHHLDEELEGKAGLIYKNCKNLDRQITLCHKCHLNLDSVKKKMSEARIKSINSNNKKGI